MTVRLYRSTDGGAPSLQGTAGTGITVLDAVLVNGYNSKTVTITRSGATATATCVSHGFPSDGLTRVAISGAGQSEYNIETYITNVTANTFDYTVAGTPATPATGTITAIIPGAGWSKTYTGTNLAAYQQAAGQQRLVRVDDSAQQSMRVVGCESMTDISTYQNPMPTAALLSGGGYWHRSTTANTTSRPWTIIATGQTFWVYFDVDSTSGTQSSVYGYGDFTSKKSGDPYNQFLISAASGTVASSNIMYGLSTYTSGFTSSGGRVIQRPFSGYGQSISCATCDWTNSITMFNGTFQYPNPANSAAEPLEIYVVEAAAIRVLRGVMPGVWTMPYAVTWATHGDYFSSNVGALNGKKFLYLKQYNASGILFEISNTW